MSGSHLPALDGLRGVAILLVLFLHAWGRMARPIDSPPLRWFFQLCAFGWTGVDLFFVLSGFLITGILLRSKGHRHYFRSFYARRTLRIFPLYYASLLFLILGLGHVSPDRPDVSWLLAHQTWFWTYTQNWLVISASSVPDGWPLVGHLWSLAVEEQFYLLWPIVVLLCSRRRLVQVCVGIVALLPLVRLALLESGTMIPEVLYHQTFTRFDALAWGALLAAIARHPGALERVRPAARVLAAAGIVWLAYFAMGDPLPNLMNPAMQISGFTWVAIISAATILEIVAPSTRQRLLDRLASRLRSGMSLAPLRSVGRVSYAMYVFHWPIMHLVWMVFYSFGLQRLPVLGCFVLYLATSGVVSYLLALASWHLLEKRFLRLKRFFPRPE